MSLLQWRNHNLGWEVDRNVGKTASCESIDTHQLTGSILDNFYIKIASDRWNCPTCLGISTYAPGNGTVNVIFRDGKPFSLYYCKFFAKTVLIKLVHFTMKTEYFLEFWVLNISNTIIIPCIRRALKVLNLLHFNFNFFLSLPSYLFLYIFSFSWSFCPLWFL